MRNRWTVIAAAAAFLAATVAVAAPAKVQPRAVQKVVPTATPTKLAIDFSKFRLTRLAAPNPQFHALAGVAVTLPPQVAKKEISCGIFVWPPPGASNPNAMSRRMFFVNNTGQVLPVGTRIEYQVEGMPAGCCHGWLQPNNFSLPPNPPSTWYEYTGDVLPVPQPWTRPCTGWAYLP